MNGKTNSVLNQTRQLYFDTGTANVSFKISHCSQLPNYAFQVQFPKDTTEALYALISPKIKAFGDHGAYGLPCSEISSIKASIDLTFKDQDGKVRLPTQQHHISEYYLSSLLGCYPIDSTSGVKCWTIQEQPDDLSNVDHSRL